MPAEPDFSEGVSRRPVGRKTRRADGFLLPFGSAAPVLSRGPWRRIYLRLLRTRRFVRATSLGENAPRNGSKPAQLRQGAAKPSARRVFRPTNRGLRSVGFEDDDEDEYDGGW